MIQKISLLILVGLLFLSGYLQMPDAPYSDSTEPLFNYRLGDNLAAPPNPQLYLVTKVIDGDTIEVLKEGIPTKVRYIGLDTPESYPPERDECFGNEATLRNRALVEGKQVRLETDTRDVDDYNRLLRYVYIGDVFVNERLIAEGFAEAKVFPPNTAFAKSFADLEAAAKSFNQGLWSACSR